MTFYSLYRYFLSIKFFIERIINDNENLPTKFMNKGQKVVLFWTFDWITHTNTMHVALKGALLWVFTGKKASEINIIVQWNLDLRKPDLRKTLDLRKIVGTTDFLVHKLFDLRKIF